jgi:DNA repair exonuclease SbcCD ATPase subunit
MSEDSKGSSGAPDANASGENQEATQTQSAQENKTKDVVAYDTYRKILSEKKKLEEKFSSIESELNTLRDEKLGAEGKKDELIESLKKKELAAQGRVKELVGSFAYSKLVDSISVEAAKQGCSNVDAFLKLVEFPTEAVDAEDGFRVNGDAIKMAIEKVKKDYPELSLFNKSVASVKAGVPMGAASGGTQNMSIKEMSMLALKGLMKD